MTFKDRIHQLLNNIDHVPEPESEPLTSEESFELDDLRREQGYTLKKKPIKLSELPPLEIRFF